MKRILLTAEDDIVSVCDRLEWADDGRLLFILPPNGGLNDPLDFVRLRRAADYKRVEVGLLTRDKRVRRQAKRLGFPIFRTVAQAEKGRRQWRRGQRRSELVGLPTKGGRPLAEWQQTARRAIFPAKRTVLTPRQWGVRYTAVFLFFIAAALMIVLFAYAVPRATITLSPEWEPITTTEIVMADPQQTTVDFANKSIPARQILLTQLWEAEVEATGRTEAAVTPAQGFVLFTNLTDEAVIVPDGTQLRTEDQRLFQAIAPVILPAAEGSTVEAAVAAVVLGPQGNVAANRVTRIVNKELARRVKVENRARMTGGGMEEVTAVSQSDLDKLRSQTLQFLQAVALAQMETSLTEREFLARESLRLVEVLSEEYSHEAGDQAERVSLKMEAVLAGTAVDSTNTAGLAYNALTAHIADGYGFIPDSLHFEPGGIIAVDDAGRVTFELEISGGTAADLAVDGMITAVAGQKTDIAAAYLYDNLPLRDKPTITLWPIWINKMPFWERRVELIIEQ